MVGARLEEPLYHLLSAHEPRNLLRSVLPESYFAPEVRGALTEQGAINQEAFLYSKRLLERNGGSEPPGNARGRSLPSGGAGSGIPARGGYGVCAPLCFVRQSRAHSGWTHGGSGRSHNPLERG